MKRSKCLKVYVAGNEYAHIHGFSSEAGLSVSSYMRKASLRRTISSKIDQLSIDQLCKINGDLARLGNLFKLAITEWSDEPDNVLAQALLEKAQNCINDIAEVRTVLKQKIQALNT